MELFSEIFVGTLIKVIPYFSIILIRLYDNSYVFVIKYVFIT